MIIIQSRGRLGNNIFQYVFAGFISKKGEKVIFTGMKGFIDVFDKVENNYFFFTAENRFTRGVVKKLIDKSLTLLVKAGFISFYGDSATGGYTYSKGFFSKITYVSGYFQNPSFFREKNLSCLLPKAEHINKAKKILENKKNSVFVHVRRGDFVSSGGSNDYLVHGESAELPLSYYKNTIKAVDNARDNVVFVFISDDPKFVEEHFSGLKNKVITSECMEVDFVVASMCDGGILSASTFSFWASMIAMHVNGAKLPFYAPKYWLGHAKKTWYPVSVKSADLTYVDV